MAGGALEPWTAADGAATFLMWAVMMVAMMVPSAAPAILLFTGMHARASTADGAARGFAFTAGYLVAWTGFSTLATLLQWALSRAALLSPMMMSTSRWLGAGILAAAAAYQVLPLKEACLRHCRAPAHFLAEHYRPGRLGALRMGLEHGLYCVGCCWLLMTLLFVGGVMNLLWIALISGFVLLEKIAPARAHASGAAAVALLLLAIRVALA